MIVAFRGPTFDAVSVAVFEQQAAWLAGDRPERFETACGANPGAAPCSELLVGTVDDWVASR
jgi:hypothetical protein